MLEESQYRRDMLQQRQQAHDDHEADLNLQRTFLQSHQKAEERQQQENAAQRADYEHQSEAQRAQDEKYRVAQQQSTNQISQAMLALHEGNNVDDDSWNKIIKNAGSGWQNWADVKSPAARKVAIDQIAKSSATASDVVVQQNLKIINAANGGDMDKTLAMYGSYSPNELNRLAHSIQNKGLKTPDQLTKEVKSDAKESANLAKDLKTVDTAYGKTFFGGKLGVGGTDARAHAIIRRAVGSTWSGTTPTERAAAERTLRQALKAKPDMSYEDMAQLLRPTGLPRNPHRRMPVA